ncbi:hypothetical protein Patl1_03322 [Pistacia atlantica]|uniref:Uncharacterized protein n=1 Tax=Pistacia atlantica TaxID=434234 RepID=A0ACC1C482_9ROSI|nr:hypothetical protein Patl1_03322 [Pistacia atlantica]
MSSLMTDFLREAGGTAVIDGGLATELERYGADLNDPLWSAKHGNMYYKRCSESAGDSIGEGRILKHRPILVAASVGSYGAYLADGSEYSELTLQQSSASYVVAVSVHSGNYGDSITLEALKDFPPQKGSDPGGIGYILIYYALFFQAYAELLEEEDIKIPAWFSFNSKDGVNVVSGDSLLECASIAESCRKVVAVGINCTPPRFINGLILAIKKVTTKLILIYPNSGEFYDADRKEWVQNTGVSDEDFVSYVSKWCEAGASLVGGCCRTTPNTIRAIYRTLANITADVPLQQPQCS